jgi:hypothetical protein
LAETSAEEMAKTSIGGAKSWGATETTSLVYPILTRTAAGDWIITGANACGIACNSYDFLNPGRLIVSGWHAARTRNGTEITFSAHDRKDTENYCIERSRDGINFEPIGFVSPSDIRFPVLPKVIESGA